MDLNYKLKGFPKVHFFNLDNRKDSVTGWLNNLNVLILSMSVSLVLSILHQEALSGSILLKTLMTINF